MRYPVFLVNLDRQPQRLRFMQAQLGALGITPIRIPAVNGRDPAERARAAAASYAQLTPGEIGCFESHRRLWQKMVDEGIPGAYVMEDDMVVSDDFAALDIPDALLPEIDLIKVDWIDAPFPCYGQRRLPLTNRRSLSRMLCTEVSTGCYFVTLMGARRLLDGTRNYMLPVDTMMFNNQSNLFWSLRVWKMRNSPAAQLYTLDMDRIHKDFSDRIQGAARPEQEKGLAATVRRFRVKLRRVLDRDISSQRQSRARKHINAFARTEPVEREPIPLDLGEREHFEQIRVELAKQDAQG